ncbi:MAG: hypothetical protein LVR00_08340 [Rhabdochlamydiaceae bacterium]|jgi:hypothetical protein
MAQNYKTNLMEDLSLLFDASEIQDSFCYRALAEARRMAEQLVSDDGKLNKGEISLKNNFYLNGFSDALIYERQSKFLERWRQDSKFFNSFKRFSLPLCHPGAEKLIRHSLQLSLKESLTDAHVKKAAISASLMILRQTVGSCFATAPAILIQEEYEDLFIQDLYDLLTRGKLKRIIRGVEYSVPLSLSWGLGDLGRPLSHQAGCSPGLIKAFEVAGVIDTRLSLDEKCTKLTQIVMGAKGGITISQFIESFGSFPFYSKKHMLLLRGWSIMRFLRHGSLRLPLYQRQAEISQVEPFLESGARPSRKRGYWGNPLPSA